MTSKTCTGPHPEGPRPAAIKGLCRGHDAQTRRGISPLRPLRGPRGQLGAKPLVRLRGLRVSPAAAERVEADPAGAREALETWAQPNPARTMDDLPMVRDRIWPKRRQP